VSKQRPKDIAASVRRRLTDLARKQGEDFQLVLTRYVIERLLYRLSQSEHGDQFTLKGAMLFGIWGDQPHRPTRDLDLLATGDNSIDRTVRVFQSVFTQAVEHDGLTFDSKTVSAERIKEDQNYEGIRVSAEVRLGQARIDLQIDIGFGDAITPQALEADYPAILEFPAPRLKIYPMATVVAEKFQAMVVLGIANSRMKDFFDLWFLSRQFAFHGATLVRAIEATFRRRKTPFPIEEPIALTAEFGNDTTKIKQWRAFLTKGRLDASGYSLAEVCAFLSRFLMPPTAELSAGREFRGSWPPGGPWTAPPSDRR
jgi:predicted nucleotidyltransferase component of viral defense system